MRNTLNELMSYCERWSHPESIALHQLERSTHLHTISPQMISGKLQGRFLSFISKLIQPSHVLDIGSFTGYSAMCLAEGLSERGTVHSIDINHDVEHIRHTNLASDPLYERIIWHTGDALQIIPQLPHPWNLVFLDAAKHSYPEFLNILTPLIPSGGVLVADNVLWYGKVLEENHTPDTAAIHLFNQRLFESTKWETCIIPLRDGLSLSIKK